MKVTRTQTRTKGGRTRAAARRPQESRTLSQGPQTAPAPRPAERPGRAKNAGQAKARAKARKAKAPEVVRPSLRDRIKQGLIAKLSGVDLRPQALVARVPFVVLIIGSLALGLGITLWLSTDAAQRSYQLGSARSLNEALSQQKEALERDVLQAESAPALAESARELGMIPSRNTAHLVLDPAGNWVVVGEPKPAAGVPPPPLNTKLPEEKPPAPTVPTAVAKPGADIEVPVRLPPVVSPAEVPVRLPAGVYGPTVALPATPAVAAPLPPVAGPLPGLPGAAVPPTPGVAPAAPGLAVPPAPGVAVPPAMAGAVLPAPAPAAVPAPAAATLPWEPTPTPAMPGGQVAPAPLEPVPGPVGAPAVPPGTPQ